MRLGRGTVCRQLIFLLVQALVCSHDGVSNGKRANAAGNTVAIFRLKRHRQLGVNRPSFSSDSAVEHIPTFSSDSDDDQTNGKGKGKGKGMSPDDDDYSALPSKPLPPTDDDIGKGKGKGKSKDEKTKSSKKDKKESKSQKKDGKSQGGGGNAPVQKPTPNPTTIPHPPPPHPVSPPSMTEDSEDRRKHALNFAFFWVCGGLDSNACLFKDLTTAASTFFLSTASRPPASIDSPNASTEPTGSPTVEGETVAVSLDLFAINYTLQEDNSVPTRDDYVALEGVTADYFETYMMAAYEASTQATLVSFETLLVTSIFR